LPKVIDLFCLLVHLDLALGNLINQLLGLTLHIRNKLNFLDVLSFQHIHFDLGLLVLIPFDNKSLEQDIDFVYVVQLLEIWLEILVHDVIRLF